MRSRWTLPTRVAPIVLEGQIGVVTQRTVELFDVAAQKIESIKTNENILMAFSSKNVIGCAIETVDGVDLEFRSGSSLIGQISHVSDLCLYSGSISACGCYCAIISGIPEFELKIYAIKTGKLVANQSLPDVTETTKVSFNPQSWREICVSDKLFISRFEIQDFIENEVSIIVENRKTIQDVFCAQKKLLSEQTSELWRTQVEYLPLNFESGSDDLGSISATTWKDSLVIFSSCFGSLYSLDGAGQIGSFLTCQDEVKNELTLQVEHFIPQPEGVNSLVTTAANDVIYGGCDGFYRIGLEGLKGKKKQRPMKTIQQIGKPLDGALLALEPISDQYLLARSKCGEKLTNQVVDISAECNSVISFSSVDSGVLTALPGPGDTLIVTKENGTVQIHQSELVCSFETKLNAKIISLENGPVENVYFGGTDTGYLLVLHVEPDNFEIVDSSRLFNAPLSSISLDPFGRALIVGSEGDDKVLALSWSSGGRMPKVIGYLPVDGIVPSVSVCSPSATAPLFVLAAISSAPGALIDACLNFQLSAESMSKGRAVHLNNLLEFEPSTVKAATVVLPRLSSIYLSSCISDRLTCFAASPQQNAIRQLDFQLGTEYPSGVEFARSLGKTVTTDISFAAPFHALWMASLCRSGALTITRNINEKITLPASRGLYAVSFSRSGEQCVAFSGDVVHFMSFEVKTELKTKIKEITKSIKMGNVFNSLAPAESVEIEDTSQSEWFRRQLEYAAVQENKKYKPTKDQIEAELNVLRERVLKMITDNQQADDLEQLDNQEFNLDQESADDFVKREQAAIEKLKTSVQRQKAQYAAMVETITKSCWTSLETGPRTLKGFSNAVSVSNYDVPPAKTEDATELEGLLDRRRAQLEEEEIRNQKKTKESVSAEDLENAEAEEGISTTGTLSDQMINQEPLLRSQFILRDLEDRKIDMAIIRDRILLLRKYFNNQFRQCFRQKEAELARIGEKNTRIEQIQEELGMTIETSTPSLNDWEMPENVFKVRDEEVNVEKVLTEEQQTKLDEERRLEELRRNAGGDNARDRALDEMMDGVLEVKSEDILKQDIPRPEFMDDPELRESEWSEEQKKAAKEYEKRVKTLEEDRLKHKKALEAEVKKQQLGVTEALASFDLALHELYNKRILAQMAIHQEQLRYARLKRGLVWKGEAGSIEQSLAEVMDTLRAQKTEKVELMHHWKVEIEKQKNLVESEQAEDKLAEKQFKSEFEKLFENGSGALESMGKPFKRRPRGGETLEQINAFSEAPVGVEEPMWDFMVEHRNAKMVQEGKLKQSQFKLNLMRQFFEARQTEEAKIENGINEFLTEANHHQLEIEKWSETLLIQLLLKQGQVEIEGNEFDIDFSDAVFLHRAVVEDLNSQIKHFGSNKIEAMLESRDFRKGIHLLEWEKKKLGMTMEDLQQKAQDIQMLKLTRELQSVLTAGNSQLNPSAELARIDRTLKSQNEQHKVKMERKKQEMKKLRRKMAELEKHKLGLNDMLEEIHVSVSERRNIQDTHIQPDTRKLMRDIARNRKLAEISRAQHNEIAVLKQELERLRKKTFPALVKINR